MIQYFCWGGYDWVGSLGINDLNPIKMPPFLCDLTVSGQMIVTSHDLTDLMVAKSKGNPLISEKPRLVKYYFIWPEIYI